MIFKNRQHAAELLMERLLKFSDQHPLVLAVPRGAVPMAELIAKNLSGDLDVVLVRKLRAPFNPEYAIGAVDEQGNILLNETAQQLSLSHDLLDDEVDQQMARIQEQRMLYTPQRKPLEVKSRIVILVDDGIATGSTLLAAIRSLKSEGAKKIVVASPVSSREAAHKIRKLADELICLEEPEDFQAVGQFYKDFSQVSDEEVIKILNH